MFKPKKEVKEAVAPKEEVSTESYAVGDIIPIQEIVGWQVIKEFDEKTNPVVITTEKRWEAELLSIAFKS